ncbi:MAG: nicotinate (nicotinamide) nucleotide adenylyltransferase [Clostridia bacterium]|nr:nicotinate (nicotinamide) nucleotide adenylyltransferase [Clostridia bacterium]
MDIVANFDDFVYNKIMKVIFGGAFNPVHAEHINMVKHLLTRNDVEKVILLPSVNPPHKTCPTSFEQRIDMLKLAIKDLDNVEISEFERNGDGKRYTCEVLPKLKEIYGDIAFVIGGDSLEDLNKWKNPHEVIKICPLLVFTRGKSEKFATALDYWRKQGGDIRVCDYSPNDVSSTVIRYNAELCIYDNLDPRVVEYIKANNLYGKYADLIAKLKSNIPKNTFEHCLRTASYAINLNYSLDLGLDYDKVLLAGVLHDCAKALCHIPHDTSEVPADSVGTPVEHQFLGAVVARKEYGIDDEEVLEAIKYHTTGKCGMTDLQKLIFSSDMLEVGRKYDEVDRLRESMKKSLDCGYKACALAQYEFLLQKGGDIYPLTLQAVEEIK